MKHHHATRIIPVLSLLLILAVWLGVPSAAFAHAKLSASSPVAGATLSVSPGKVDLQFTESVSLQFTTIKLLDRARQELSVGPPTLVGSDGMHVTATLPTSLPNGAYTVVWRTLSATDGHITTGNFAFRVVGSGAAAGSTGAQGAQGGPSPEPDTALAGSTDVEGTSDQPDPLRWLVRAVMLASAALLAGGAIFSGLILRPLVTGETGDGHNAALAPVLRRKFGAAGTLAAALLLLSLMLDMVLQVGSITGGGLLDGVGNLGFAGTLLTTTGYGYAWIVKVAATVVLLAAMLLLWRGAGGREAAAKSAPAAWTLAGAAGITLALGEALSSHAAAEGNSTAAAAASEGAIRLYSGFLSLPLLSDWAHLATAFTWIGGVAYMAFVLFPSFRSAGMQAGEQRAFLARAVPRFSRLAIGSVVLLGTTGLYNIIVRTTDLGAILGSLYGQVLAVKIVLFVFLVALGAVNLLKLTPELLGKGTRSGATSDPSQGLRRSVRLEIVPACGAFLCAAGLSLLAPPSSPGTAYAGATGLPVAQATTPPLETPTPAAPLTSTSQVKVGGYTVTLYANSSLAGDVFTATLDRVDPAAAPLTDVDKVIFRVTPQDMNAGTSSITGTLQSKAGSSSEIWQAGDAIFTLDGGYLVELIAQRTQADDLKAAFRFDLTEDTGLKERSSQVVEVHLDTDPSPPISGTGTLKIALVDGTNAPVDGATITVHPLMPAHGHVEPTGDAAPVPGQHGQYTMPVHFTMGGAWLVVFDITIPGHDPIQTDAGLDVIGPEINTTP